MQDNSVDTVLSDSPDIRKVVVLIVHQFLTQALIQQSKGALEGRRSYQTISHQFDDGHLEATVQVVTEGPGVEIVTEGWTLSLDISKIEIFLQLLFHNQHFN